MSRTVRARQYWPLIAGFLMVATALPVYAFNLDSNNPIKVESDNARLDDQKGTATYTGSVRVTQGKAVLTAERVVLHRGDGQSLNRMKATGEPATYEQPESPQGPAIYAEGETIIYRAAAERITFEHKALIRQRGDTFQGNRIVYDVAERVVTASSASDDDSDRVEMTIQPGRNSGNNNSSSD
ncbi:lipopolysaccharide transport periplasmic protein LptA [Salicola sp. Rm-C-2C1-2]|uniref:lipopolysaccharide transport periplasmic protein LptA n=1 Tax=Salicola sp. Rm-C-2C1-2 TaxID=3141321 RepID=UPI0032E4C3BA